MQNSYLIPANSKRSMLILSLFAPIDVVIFAIGSVTSFALVMALNGTAKSLTDILFLLLPAIVSAAMVVPVPNHRNVWQLTAHVYTYLINNRHYYWKGWCFNNGGNKKQ